MIFGINTTRHISKLSQLRITISKYHSWYLCQISLQIMLLPILIVQCQHFRIFTISRTTTNRQKMEVFHLDKQKVALLVGITE